MRRWLRRKFHTCHYHSVGVIKAPSDDNYPCGSPRRRPLQSDFIDVYWCCVDDHVAYGRRYIYSGELLPDDWRETALPKVVESLVKG